MSRSYEIAGPQLKPHIVSSKSFKFTPEGGHLEPRGQITLEVEDASKVDVYLHRLGGNGHFNINLDNSEEFKIVLSKTPQKFTFPFSSGQVKISRPQTALGKIAITKIEVYTEKEEVSVAKNWRALIKRCGRYGSLRLVEDQLFASEGGFIEDHGRISKIVTEPQNMSVREGNKVNFIKSCKIIDLELTAPDRTPKEELFPSRKAAGPSIHPTNTVRPVGSVTPERVPQPIVDLSQATRMQHSMVVYDSSALKGFQKYLHVKSKHVSTIKSNGKEYLLLRGGGTGSLSISTLQPNKDYVITVTGKCLNGNGKLNINVSVREGDLSHHQELMMNRVPNFEHKYVHIKSPKIKYGETPKINIFMPHNGEVLIERVLVVDSGDIRHTQNMMEGGSFTPRPRSAPPTLSADQDLQVESEDPIFQKSKRYARYASFTAPKIEISGAMCSDTFAGLSWINKIVHTSNVKLENNPHSLLITNCNSSQFHVRNWLEPFNFISPEQIEKIKESHIIFTPSKYNKQYLEEKCPNTKIILLSKPLPWVPPQEIKLFNNLNYVVAFHRDDATTQALTNSWNASLPRLVLIGARGSFGSNILPVNEYVSYGKLLYIIQKSKGIIDISLTYHADFSFQELAHDLGLPVLTNSWSALTNPRSIFLTTERGIPKKEGIYQGVDRLLLLERKECDKSLIEQKFSDRLHSLFNSS